MTNWRRCRSRVSKVGETSRRPVSHIASGVSCPRARYIELARSCLAAPGSADATQSPVDRLPSRWGAAGTGVVFEGRSLRSRLRWRRDRRLSRTRWPHGRRCRCESRKVALVARGRSPFVEPGLDELLAAAVAAGRLTATTDPSAAAAAEISLISVGTPSSPRGEHDTSQVVTVCRQIAAALAASEGEHVIVLRSTVPPGTLDRCRELFLAEGLDGHIHYAFNPEFLREGSAIGDYDNPPYTIIGTDDPVADAALRELLRRRERPMLTVAPAVAELVKSVANAWHATKISFANEVGRLAQALDVDGRAVMDVIVQDTKLNVSAAYLMPGYAYGGSCLPKDTRGLIFQGRERGVAVPLLESLPASNRGADGHWRPRPCSSAAHVACWCADSPSSAAPTTCARARPWRSSSASSARAARCASSTPTCASRTWSARTSPTSATTCLTSRRCWSTTPAEWLAWADIAVVTYASPDFAARAPRTARRNAAASTSPDGLLQKHADPGLSWRLPRQRPHPRREPPGAVRPARLDGGHHPARRRLRRGRGVPDGQGLHRRSSRSSTASASTATRSQSRATASRGYFREYWQALWSSVRLAHAPTRAPPFDVDPPVQPARLPVSGRACASGSATACASSSTSTT